MNIKDNYYKESSFKKNDFEKFFNISQEGLSDTQIPELSLKYGKNELSQNMPKKWYNYFFSVLLSPFNCILLGIAITLFYTDIYIAEQPSYVNIIVILILVTTSTLLEFFEEYNSNKAAEKLKQMVETTAIVIRNGKEQKIPVSNLTIGDIVILSAGSLVPADLRVLEAKDLYVSQSSLTGESDSIKKVVDTNLSEIQFFSISDLDNICFMGTNVISGSAKCAVIKVGDNTYLGQINKEIPETKPKSNFQIGIEGISKLLIRFMLVLVPIVFLLNIAKHSTLIAFTFSVAVAICITPLLLPVILSSSLSRGAIKMAKKKTIVKKLDSIQNFGAMNILCTDKTGTLTENKIVLEKYLDVNGNEDLRVLKHAFLNSYFQTGLKGSIDEAVIARGITNGMESFKTKYFIVDEIPFDFSRRRLSVIVSDGFKKQLITKGAVEEILDICTLVDFNGQVSPITSSIKQNIKKIAKNLNSQGLRVIAVAQKNDINFTRNFSIADENNMVLMGFIGFLDPPKKSAKSAIENLNNSGIRVIVLTGDNLEVTKCICEKVGINSKKIIDGKQIEKMSDLAITRILRKTNIFVKLSPIQKARIVRLLKEDGNTVGYIGDGINDAPSIIDSDVGISVDTAVDIAKESADIILLEKDLHVLLDGVREGRKTFGNLMKYIKMSTSFNFGEVVSVIIASVALPFLPETPIQLLVEGLLYDFGQLTLPFDNVDEEYLETPKQFDSSSLKHFMFFMGSLSSIFDLIVFAFLWFAFNLRDAATFQTIWFSYSIVSNLLGMHIIRTAKLPFIQSNAKSIVYFSSFLLMFIGILVPFTWLGKFIGLVSFSLKYLSIILLVPVLYCFVALIAKKIYLKLYREWI